MPVVNRLNLEQRQRDLNALATETFDVVVIGGGVLGAGIALDAASRGLRTAIVEAQDWASGTSSRSTGLVLDGLPSLHKFDPRSTLEMVKERAILLNVTAPHLVKPQSFIWPMRSGIIERMQKAAVVGLQDLLTATAGHRTLPMHRRRSRSGTIERFPGVRTDSLVGGVEFQDATVDDARLVLALVRTAVEYGAVAVNRVEVVKITRSASVVVSGLVVRDLETDAECHVSTRGVIAAAGVWTEHIEDLAETGSGLKVLASKGVHIMVPRDRIDSRTGVFVRGPESTVVMIPRRNHWVIGATDTAWHHTLSHPVATSQDVDVLLAEVNKVLARPLTREDVCGTFAGLHASVQRGAINDWRTTMPTSGQSLATVAPGIVAVAGGRFANYRTMAAEAIDLLLGRQQAAKRPSITARTPLLGAQGLEAMTNQSDRIGGIYAWSAEQMEHLLGRYGSELPELLELVDDDPTLAAPLYSALDSLRVEVAWACVAEGAVHLEDILMRRLRLSVDCTDRGVAAADEVAAIAASLLDWDDERLASEKKNYRAVIAAEEAATRQPTDAAALAERRRAQDIAPSGLDAQ